MLVRERVIAKALRAGYLEVMLLFCYHALWSLIVFAVERLKIKRTSALHLSSERFNIGINRD